MIQERSVNATFHSKRIQGGVNARRNGKKLCTADGHENFCMESNNLCPGISVKMRKKGASSTRETAYAALHLTSFRKSGHERRVPVSKKGETQSRARKGTSRSTKTMGETVTSAAAVKVSNSKGH